MALSGQTSTIRVVFIDDDPGLCQLVNILLGWEPDIDLVGVATTGTQGVELVTELRPDITVSDFRLPDISGVEVGNRVSEKYPDTRILLISGHDVDELREELKMVLFTYVDKQTAFRDFPGLIRQVCA